MPDNSAHVRHLLNAYVHRQLSRRQRLEVVRHVQTCNACRAALTREETVIGDLKSYMPLLGQPTFGQLAHLWPAIWAEVQKPRNGAFFFPTRIPSLGIGLVAMLVCALFASALLTGSHFVTAAPLQAIPAEVRATATPISTEHALIQTQRLAPRPTSSATAELIRVSAPEAQPVPPAGTSVPALTQ